MYLDKTEFDAATSVLSKSDGSARFSINGTTQICSVFGPGEVRLMKELAERAYVNIVYKPRIGNTTNREKVIEYELRSILDGVILTNLHPRTSINIVLQEVQDNGNYLGCALNCLCLCLLDGNIPMKHIFAAVSCSLIENESRVIFFPGVKEEKESNVTATFVFESINKELIFMNTNGRMNQDTFNNLLNNARQYAIDKIFPLLFSLIENKYSQN